MARIVTALKTHHHVGPAGQPVNNFAFAFIAPLGADHGYVGHRRSAPEKNCLLVKKEKVTPKGKPSGKVHPLGA